MPFDTITIFYLTDVHYSVTFFFCRPPDYHIYVFSALAMCFMCPPFGITALVFTLQAQTLHRKGNLISLHLNICHCLVYRVHELYVIPQSRPHYWVDKVWLHRKSIPICHQPTLLIAPYPTNIVADSSAALSEASCHLFLFLLLHCCKW